MGRNVVLLGQRPGTLTHDPFKTTVVFNYYVGFTFEDTDGNYELLFPRRGNLDFGAERVPLPLPLPDPL